MNESAPLFGERVHTTSKQDVPFSDTDSDDTALGTEMDSVAGNKSHLYLLWK